jgi:hypothetical protein
MKISSNTGRWNLLYQSIPQKQQQFRFNNFGQDFHDLQGSQKVFGGIAHPQKKEVGHGSQMDMVFDKKW